MYTGTMIDELIATVERAEVHAGEQQRQERVDYWYAVVQQEITQFESSFAGVA